MSRRDDSVSLQDMLSHATEAVELLGDRSLDQLKNDRVLQLALTRLIEVVGEAANRVSQAGRQQRADVPWPEVIGMRNRLIHGYDVVDVSLLWDTVRTDLPPLIQTLKRIRR